jgi:glycosyltransferase involved in cell wall biosynthesis
MPVSILEAMSRGLPVIATKHASIPAIVSHGDSGLLSAEGDVESMMQTMVRLAADRHAVERMGDAARQYVMDNHDWQTQRDKLLEVIGCVCP